MKTKEIASEMIKGIEKEDRNRIRIYDDDFRYAIIDALEKEGSDYSDEELEDFVGDCETYFIEEAQEKGWLVDFICNGIVITKE
jgi:hypothetical protein